METQLIHLALNVAAALFLIAVACLAILGIAFIGLILWAFVKAKTSENRAENGEPNKKDA
jgi:hypothetical protein